LTKHPVPIKPFPHLQQSGGGAVNRVQKFREAALMAKAELARKAGVSESTIDRVEAGHDCRMETKRKILFALGLTVQDGQKLFPRNGARVREGNR
jgi:DNA-binding XRE family transcriptional regulator